MADSLQHRPGILMLQRRQPGAKRFIRRTLQVLAFVATIVVGILALALIASQTPWVHEWLRKYVTREANQYLNGQLSIGHLGGNLFYGLELSDVALDAGGGHVVTVQHIDLRYSVVEMIATGIVIQQIVLDRPVVHLRHTAQGWNVSALVKKQQQEANRKGPGRPIAMPDIEIVNGDVFVDDRAPSTTYRLPGEMAALNVKAGFQYAPVHYSVTLDRFDFRGTDPDLTVRHLTGRVGERDDDLHVERLSLQTGGSSVVVDGVVRHYLHEPDLQVTVTSPGMSLPELSGVLPVLKGYDLHPVLDVKASGPLDRLTLEVKERSEAGAVAGTVVADLHAPDLGARGQVDLTAFNLAPVLKDPAERSDITGHATLDLTMKSEPASASALERMSGRFSFRGPHVLAAGYRASDVVAAGTIAGRRISFDGRANAYGGAATAKGFIVTAARPGLPLQFDVSGRASHIDLRGLPASLNAPKVASDLNASAFHVAGHTGDIQGRATLQASTLEGATIGAGTQAQFGVAGKTISYSAQGRVAGLDLERIGRAFDVTALAKPAYASRIDAQFDVTGKGTALPAMTLDATGTVTDSQIMGGTIPHLVFEAHLADGGLQGHATGDLRGFDPARVSGNDTYKGTVNASVDAGFGIRDLSAVTADAITADGQVVLTDSRIARLQIDSADVQGRYADRRGTLRQLTVKGPDLDVTASGAVALDQTGSSNVKYHVVDTNLARIGGVVNQPIAGSVTLDGTLTGNANALSTSGTLNGSNLSYQTDKALDLNSTYEVSIPDLQFADAHVKATTKGTFISVSGFDINQLTATTTYGNHTLGFQTHIAQRAEATGAVAEAAAGHGASPLREIDATGRVIFHPDHQEIHLPRLAVRTQGVEWQTAAGVEPTIQYGNDRLEIDDLTLVSGSQQLAVSGAFALGAGEPSGTLNVRAQHVDIAQVERLLMQNRGLSGRLDANAQITGTAKSPNVTGHVAITDGGFQQFTYQSLTVDGGYDGSRITVDAKLTQAPGVALTAKGTLPISALEPTPPGGPAHVPAHGADSIDVRIQSTPIGLALVEGFTTQVTDVKGTLQADVRVTGSGEDPHFDGHVDIQGGAFGVVAAGVSFTGLTTRIELDPDRIRIPRFQILDEDGHPMTIAGDLAIHARQLGNVDVSVTSDNFKIIDNELGKANIQTKLQLSGDLRHPKLTGDVQTDSARLQIDKILLLTASPYAEHAMPRVVSAEQTVEGTSSGTDRATRRAFEHGRELSGEAAARAKATARNAPAPASGPMAALALDIHFRAPDDLVVRGDDLRPGGPTAAQIGNVNATLGADLHITKVPGGQITITGTVDTVRGFYEFQGRRFTLARGGTIRFLGLPELNPSIDVTADRLIPNSGVTATVHVTGTVKAPELSLTSKPALDEADILSMIVFNRPVNELGTGERSSLAETAGGIASGFIAAPLGKSIGKALDVDLFEITTTDPQTGESAGGVTLGKQVNEKTFVQFRQQFGPRSVTEFMIEYQLADFLRLRASAAPETSGVANRLTQRRVERGGVDLIFFFSY